jgi:hypothetical protein
MRKRSGSRDREFRCHFDNDFPLSHHGQTAGEDIAKSGCLQNCFEPLFAVSGRAREMLRLPHPDPDFGRLFVRKRYRETTKQTFSRGDVYAGLAPIG